MSKRRQKNWKINLKFFFFFVGGLVFLSLLFKTAQIIKNSIFDGQNRITLVLAPPQAGPQAGQVGEDIIVFSLEPQNKTISLLIIPANTNAQVPKNYGTYQLGNVYKLGNLGSPPAGGGGRLLQKTTQDFIGAPVEGWMITNLKLGDGKSKNLIKDALWGWGTLETNLTMLDMLRIWYEAKNVTIDKIEIVDLRNKNVLSETHLMDNTQVYKAEEKALDEISSTLFFDPKVLSERKTVEIVNGTNIPGIGGKVARIVSNMGAQVLSVKTSQEEIVNSSIITDQGSYTSERLSKTLDFPIAKDVKPHQEQKNADILVLIGTN